jgi:predicted amidophosphoribosyltransferase
MICPNCERKANWTKRRCPACRTKLPVWYVTATLVLGAALYAAFLVVENIF